jgi:cysteine synthase A
MNNLRRDNLLDSVLDAIGNTPLVELSRITRGLEGRILAKLEFLNPGFSKKDRIALQMIEESESDGSLRPGQTVIEATERITKERKAFRADQFRLPGSARAHYLNTAREIIRQAQGKVDVFCDFVGTGSSFGGCSAAFKEFNPNIQCYIIEPVEAAILAGQPVTNPNHRLQGGGYSMTDLPLIDQDLVDGYLQVTDEEAIEMTRRLAEEEGIFAGFSSGTNVAAAMQLLKTTSRGKSIAVLLCDSGLKYLSTDLWL